MKRYIVLSLLCGAFLSCSKSNQYVPAKSSIITFVPTGKKGADFNTSTQIGTWWGNTINLQSNWYYTWGNSIPLELAPQNAEFVPMFWSKAAVTDANVAYTKQLATQGRARYVLGFNEPDLADQSNMTVADALAAWPQLEAIGLPLGRPA